jgi:hypothetical protein
MVQASAAAAVSLGFAVGLLGDLLVEVLAQRTTM